MDKTVRENWQRVKDHMEEMDTKDNYFYKRAVAILSGQADPMETFNPADPTDPTD